MTQLAALLGIVLGLLLRLSREDKRHDTFSDAPMEHRAVRIGFRVFVVALLTAAALAVLRQLLFPREPLTSRDVAELAVFVALLFVLIAAVRWIYLPWLFLFGRGLYRIMTGRAWLLWGVTIGLAVAVAIAIGPLWSLVVLAAAILLVLMRLASSPKL